MHTVHTIVVYAIVCMLRILSLFAYASSTHIQRANNVHASDARLSVAVRLNGKCNIKFNVSM